MGKTSQTKVGLFHIWIFQKLGTGPLCDQSPILKHIAILYNGKNRPGILLRNQNGDTRLLINLSDSLSESYLYDWRQTKQGFIQKQELWLSHKGSPNS